MARDVEPITLTVTGPRAVLAARLCNFPTGRAALLSAHVSWLASSKVQSALRRPDNFINLFGFASRRAEPVFNERLSEQRCQSVRAQIAAAIPQARFVITHGYGEEQSTGGPNDNDGYWRAVDVYISYISQGPIPLPPPPARAPAGSTRWRIRVLSAAGGG